MWVKQCQPFLPAKTSWGWLVYRHFCRHEAAALGMDHRQSLVTSPVQKMDPQRFLMVKSLFLWVKIPFGKLT